MKKGCLSFIPQNNECDFKRIEKLQDRMYHRKATLCVERAEIYTEVFKETEGESMILRKAEAFKKTFDFCIFQLIYNCFIINHLISSHSLSLIVQ